MTPGQFVGTKALEQDAERSCSCRRIIPRAVDPHSQPLARFCVLDLLGFDFVEWHAATAQRPHEQTCTVVAGIHRMPCCSVHSAFESCNFCALDAYLHLCLYRTRVALRLTVRLVRSFHATSS
mmetsp:Transcript_41592/g.115749  ORF Transcript_41592/g.115749 Transcript_41592/m.115749 type:complete len:123 (+) Transcript_41592:1340-1708(+)